MTQNGRTAKLWLAAQKHLIDDWFFVASTRMKNKNSIQVHASFLSLINIGLFK
jgi:hypothetical protein